MRDLRAINLFNFNEGEKKISDRDRFDAFNHPDQASNSGK